MASPEQPTPLASIDPETRIGAVALSVADLRRSLGFYTDALGFDVLRQTEGEAVLGVGATPLLLLTEQPGALPWMVDAMTGLYHFAILLPTRADLGRWLRHFVSRNYPPPGQGDHVVSEALYLRDPDGHGIEVYADRPRESWRWVEGQVQMGGGPVDVRGLFAEAERAGRPWSGLPAGTTIGHVHLQVGDVAEAEAFYQGVLGFDVVARMPTALFVSAGGYHHHLGLNTWHSKGAAPAPADTATLRYFTLALPSDQARAAVLDRIGRAGLRPRESGGVVALEDPWHNTVVLHTGAAPDADDASRLLSKGA
ncbi:MAG TPA: VOC family protein [Chloroflexota bacterium]|jgi:catechol 2,3-dioxygenase